MSGVTERKAQPGDVCELALGDGRFAYGRVLKDASIAVYRSTTDFPAAPPIGERKFLFTVGVYDDFPGTSSAPVVGHDAFSSDDEAWPPPYKVVDPISGQLRNYHHGEIQEADDPVAASELEKAAVWDLRHLVERIREELSL
jgi:hypothetical protein